MEQQKLIEVWKTDYRSKHGIPQGREVSDSELLEQMAIDALKQSRQAAVSGSCEHSWHKSAGYKGMEYCDKCQAYRPG